MKMPRLTQSRYLTAFLAAGLLSGCADSTTPAPAPHADTSTPDNSVGQDSAAADTTEQPPECIPDEVSKNWWELGMADPLLDELVLYYLGGAAYGASDVAEVLETAKRVTDAAPATWTREWLKTADRLNAIAEAADAAGHSLSAGYAYYRSSTYLRAAMHYHDEPYSPTLKTLAEAEVARFTKYLDRIHPEATVLQIPYEDTHLVGYFFRGAPEGQKAPTIITHSGRDAWAEDLVFTAKAAMERGYNALLIDGPGQGKVMRIQGLPFRHDWEAFITPVVDHLLATRAEVDPDRLVLMGASMGGFLAPRAATREHRLKLVVANPGVVDWSGSIRATMGSYLPDFEERLTQGPEAFNGYVEALLEYSDFLRWGFQDMAWHHGVTKPYDFMKELEKFTIAGEVDQIQARVLVIDAEDEGPRGQSQLLFDALPAAQRDTVVFTREEAAQFHVQPGATAILTQKVFDWVDDHIND